MRDGSGGGTHVPGAITYDPAGASGMLVRDANGQIVPGRLSGPVILAHELIHEDHYERGGEDKSTGTHILTNGGVALGEKGPSEEFRTVGFSPFVRPGDITENQLEREMQEPQRATYTTDPEEIFTGPEQ